MFNSNRMSILLSADDASYVISLTTYCLIYASRCGASHRFTLWRRICLPSSETLHTVSTAILPRNVSHYNDIPSTQHHTVQRISTSTCTAKNIEHQATTSHLKKARRSCESGKESCGNQVTACSTRGFSWKPLFAQAAQAKWQIPSRRRGS